MLDMFLQHLVGRKPDGIANVPWLQVSVYLRLGKGSISPKQQPPFSFLVSLHNRLHEFPPERSAVDIARPQYRPFAVTELVEAKERMIAHTAEVTVIDRSLLLSI